MKTIEMKKYTTPQMDIVLVQSQQTLLTGSNSNVHIGGFTGGGEMGDEWDTPNP